MAKFNSPIHLGVKDYNGYCYWLFSTSDELWAFVIQKKGEQSFPMFDIGYPNKHSAKVECMDCIDHIQREA